MRGHRHAVCLAQTSQCSRRRRNEAPSYTWRAARQGYSQPLLLGPPGAPVSETREQTHATDARRYRLFSRVPGPTSDLRRSSGPARSHHFAWQGSSPVPASSLSNPDAEQLSAHNQTQVRAHHLRSTLTFFLTTRRLGCSLVRHGDLRCPPRHINRLTPSPNPPPSFTDTTYDDACPRLASGSPTHCGADRPSQSAPFVYGAELEARDARRRSG